MTSERSDPPQPTSPENWDSVLCPSPAMQRVYQLVERLAGTELNLLIVGEPGTGREHLANMIHEKSSYAHRGFQRFNWGGIQVTELDRRLFGRNRSRVAGDAVAGTLFFPDVDHTDAQEQHVLLQMLLRRESEWAANRLGASRPPRIVASASPELSRLVDSRSFPAELFERLRAMEIHVPPLRQRPEDIVPLARCFYTEWQERYGADPERELAPEVLEALQAYPWPGNVRELKSFLKRSVFRGESPEETISRLQFLEPRDRRPSSASLPEVTRQAVARLERAVIERVLRANGWDCRLASEQLGISPRSLREKIRRHGLGDRGL